MTSNDECGSFKIVSVGDGSVGKTCLLVSYAQNRFPEEYVPTVFDNYRATVRHGEKIVELDIWDTAGQEVFGKLRKLSYLDTDLFLICFSLVCPTSWENVVTHWAVELNEEEYFDKEPVIVLVGTKMDIRDDPKIIKELKDIGERPVTREAGIQLADSIGADMYCETSAKTMKGVKDLFTKCIDLLLINKEKMKKKSLRKFQKALSLSQGERMMMKKKKKKSWWMDISNCDDCDCESELFAFIDNLRL